MKSYDFPLIMSAPMVLALLRQVRGKPGGKTQTRRFETPILKAAERAQAQERPLRAWVREGFMPAPMEAAPELARPTMWHIAYAVGGDREAIAPSGYKPMLYNYERWSPCIHMPRWVSRLTLLDVSIRRERLGDISEEDARAEGIKQVWDGVVTFISSEGPGRWVTPWKTARDAYSDLWDRLHGPGAWERDADKEVIVISFRPMLANIDEPEAQGGADHG